MAVNWFPKINIFTFTYPEGRFFGKEVVFDFFGFRAMYKIEQGFDGEVFIQLINDYFLDLRSYSR